MHWYAFSKREGLQLDGNEILQTKSRLCELAIYAAFGLVSIVLAYTENLVPFSGLLYILLGPAQGLNGYLWGRWIDESEEDRPENAESSST